MKNLIETAREREIKKQLRKWEKGLIEGMTIIKRKENWFSDEFGRSNGGPMMLVCSGDDRHVIIDKVFSF